jgi:hypothetical protein
MNIREHGFNQNNMNIREHGFNQNNMNIREHGFNQNNTLGTMIKIIRQKNDGKPFVLLCFACRKHGKRLYKYSIMKNLNSVTKKNSFRFKDIEDHKYILYK